MTTTSHPDCPLPQHRVLLATAIPMLIATHRDVILVDLVLVHVALLQATERCHVGVARARANDGQMARVACRRAGEVAAGWAVGHLADLGGRRGGLGKKGIGGGGRGAEAGMVLISGVLILQ